MEGVKLSVILPVYNAESYVAEAIVGILNQTFQNFELLIIDDGSTDQSWDEIGKFNDEKRIRTFRNSVNKGKNSSVNEMLPFCFGEYITIHDADDISLPDRFQKQLSFLISHPEYALCGTNFISFLPNGKIIDRSQLETDPEQLRIKIAEQSQFHGPTVIFKKSILSAVGGLYRYFTQAEDIDFTMRVAERYLTVNLSECLYLYRHVESSLTNRIDGYTLQRLGHAKLLYYLASERRSNNGIDSLMRGDSKKIDDLMKEFVKEYSDDTTIALRRGVFRLLGMHMYENAVHLAWRALKEQITVLNIKCFVYAILQFVKSRVNLLLIKERVDLSFLKR